MSRITCVFAFLFVRRFKEAHTFIKRVLVQLERDHEHQVNQDWILNHNTIRALPASVKKTLLQQLRALVIGFDNITAAARSGRWFVVDSPPPENVPAYMQN